MLTYGEGLKWFDYNATSGVIRWRGGNRRGCIAGCSTRRYVWIKLNGRYFSGHKIAWLMTHKKWPTRLLDHINGDTFDNRISNLREATALENKRNRRVRHDNKSGLKGVQLRSNGQWRARIFIDGRSVNLGHFETAEAAHEAYKKAAINHHGDFAKY